MDKHQVIQIILTISLASLVFYIGTFVVYTAMENTIMDLQGVCDNMTPETYNITKNHEACKFNETTGKYDLNITVLADVRS
jgi:hypothetical protein